MQLLWFETVKVFVSVPFQVCWRMFLFGKMGLGAMFMLVMLLAVLSSTLFMMPSASHRTEKCNMTKWEEEFNQLYSNEDVRLSSYCSACVLEQCSFKLINENGEIKYDCVVADGEKHDGAQMITSTSDCHDLSQVNVGTAVPHKTKARKESKAWNWFKRGHQPTFIKKSQGGLV